MGPGAHKARGSPGKKSYYLRQFVCEATGSGLGQTIVSVESYNTAVLTLYTTKLSIAVQTDILFFELYIHDFSIYFFSKCSYLFQDIANVVFMSSPSPSLYFGTFFCSCSSAHAFNRS